ncbi:MAG: glycosyl transferase family 28 [Propionibacteriales bacterium]|nr:glycosyl transferase family 28 [Propionibacteriales bacterium]
MSDSTSHPYRVLLYSHDSVGLGHTRRNLALAHAIADQVPAATGREVTGLLVTGADQAAGFDLPPGFDLVVLPGISKGRYGYEPRKMHLPMATLIDVRERMLRGVMRGFAADLVVVDRHVYGVDGELRRALRALRRRSPTTRIVLGLREVLDSPSAMRREWAALGDLSEVRSVIDELWVYGDPAVHDVVASGEVPAVLADLVQYTGYLATGRRLLPETEPTPTPYVLTMVGGGSDGGDLCRLAAVAAVPEGHQHLIVTGPEMTATERAEVTALAGADTRVLSSVPDGLATISGAAAVVSMAGYNTVCEVLVTDTPALLVPRELPRQEQLIRARALSRRGAFDLARRDALTAEGLSAWLAGAVTRTQSRSGIDRSGLAGVVDRVVALSTTTQEVSHVAG